jgi:site-specific DNA-adenine methylase
MVCYYGGKQKIGKCIAKVIVNTSLDIIDDKGFRVKGYCEPFCGMLGVYKHIPELFSEEIGGRLSYKAGDSNKSVILMWQAAQKGWKPPVKASKKQYDSLKDTPDSALKAYVGHQYSFGGQYFNGYAPSYGKTANSSKASNNIVNIADELRRVIFKAGSYTQFSGLKGYVIYCDPPYHAGTRRYYENERNKMAFDIDSFWEWCSDMSEHNIVFVSGYSAPKNFETVFSSSHKLTGIGAREGAKSRTEKLFLV